MTDQPYKEVQTRIVSAENIEPKSYLLSPLDLYPYLTNINLAYQVFYNYQLDGDKLAHALAKLLYKYPILCGRYHPDKDTQFVIKVDPSDKERCSVPLYEIQSPLTISKAVVKHGRSARSADVTDVTAFPFFCAKMDILKKLGGDEPILKVKLTHFADGCCLAITLCHGMADGESFDKLFCDLSEIYRGEEIGDVCHDRSYLWPDRLVEIFPVLGDEYKLADAPRKAAEKRAKMSSDSLYVGRCQHHALHVPQEDIEALKSKIEQILKEGQTVSLNDILSSMFWMFMSELEAKKQPIMNAKDLELDNTCCALATGVLPDGYKIVPDNYFGNAFVFFPVIYGPQNGESKEPASYIEALSKLAVAVRDAVAACRKGPDLFLKVMTATYDVFATGCDLPPLPAGRLRASIADTFEIREKEADFGEGRPVLTFQVSRETFKKGSILHTGPNQKGAIMHFFLAETQKEFLKQSVVLRELVPGAKDIFEFTADEFAKKIGLKE